MTKPLNVLTLIVLTAILVTAWPALDLRAFGRNTPVTPLPAQSVAQQPPRIDVVFALDTTGSMGGLIHAAKEKIWSIATTMAQAQPAPEIRIGLVAYRDRGDEYVTRTFDLSTDLDSIYAELMELRAMGGGDGPEAVNKALSDAVETMSWRDDDNTYRVVFLVGDAPPHNDYQDEPQAEEIVDAARARGIVINTIRCGTNEQTRRAWQHIADLAQGEFFNVGQNGDAVAIATPFDERIARLSADLDDTRMAYGDAEVQARFRARQKTADKLFADASAASLARRAAYNATAAGASNLLGEHDLVSAVEEERVDIASMAPAAMPEVLRELTPAERKAAVLEQGKKRRQLSAEIESLNKQRREFIADKLEKEGGARASLDHKIFDTVKRQTREMGLSYDEAPSY